MCCLLWVSSVEAQRFEGALVGGVNMTQLDGDDLLGYRKIGFNVGARVNTVLSERWRVALEMLFTQQGSRRGRLDDPGSLDFIRLNMVEVPLMLNFRDWKFDVGAGLSYGRLVNFKVVEVNGEDITDFQNYAENIVSVVFDATFYFRENMGFNLRWSRHLTSIDDDPINGSLKGRNVSLRLLYQL